LVLGFFTVKFFLPQIGNTQKRKQFQCASETLAHDSQRSIGPSRTKIVKIYKNEDQICELNYRGTKYEIRVKLGTKSASLSNIYVGLKADAHC